MKRKILGLSLAVLLMFPYVMEVRGQEAKSATSGEAKPAIARKRMKVRTRLTTVRIPSGMGSPFTPSMILPTFSVLL